MAGIIAEELDDDYFCILVPEEAIKQLLENLSQPPTVAASFDHVQALHRGLLSSQQAKEDHDTRMAKELSRIDLALARALLRLG